MEWQVPFSKPNGSFRKQFASWSVPAKFGVNDGEEIHIDVRYGESAYSKFFLITSGREFRLPKAVFEEVAAFAKREPGQSIRFISRSDLSLKRSDLPPERREYLRELYVRDQKHVRQLKALYSGMCQVTGKLVLGGIAGDITEVHHIVWLTRDGKDTPDNMIVVSPDIHAAIHAMDGNLEWNKGQPTLILGHRHFPLVINKHLKPPS